MIRLLVLCYCEANEGKCQGLLQRPSKRPFNEYAGTLSHVRDVQRDGPFQDHLHGRAIWPSFLFGGGDRWHGHRCSLGFRYWLRDQVYSSGARDRADLYIRDGVLGIPHRGDLPHVRHIGVSKSSTFRHVALASPASRRVPITQFNKYAKSNLKMSRDPTIHLYCDATSIIETIYLGY